MARAFPVRCLFPLVVAPADVEVALKTRTLGSLIVAAASSGLVACGGGGSNPNPVTPTPPPATAQRVVLIDSAPFSLQPGTATFKNIDFPPAGTIDGMLDWNGAADMNLYVTDNTCPGFNTLKAGGCSVLVRAEGTAKPETLTFTAAANKIYTFWIHNNGTANESGSLTVGDTTTHPISQQPSPSPGATPDPRAGLAPGPVARYTIKVRSIDTGGKVYRDPFQDSAGRWVVYPGEFVVFDSTQKNAGGEICVWVNNPAWELNDPTGVLTLRPGQNEPFLLRTDVDHKGEMSLTATVDGVTSNVLEISATGRP
jgi:hypothetical protein